MALFLAQGKLVYTFNVAEHRVKIRSKENYNENAWHDVSSLNLCILFITILLCIKTAMTNFVLLTPKVIFIRDGSMGRLIIDGLTVLEDRAPGSNVSWHVGSPIYIGGVPLGTAQKNVQVRDKFHTEEI